MQGNSFSKRLAVCATRHALVGELKVCHGTGVPRAEKRLDFTGHGGVFGLVSLGRQVRLLGEASSGQSGLFNSG